MVVNDEFYLNLAINAAWKYQGLTYPNPAVGCVVLDKNGKILSIQAHKYASGAHSELLAAKEALLQINPQFNFLQEPEKLYYEILNNHQNLLKDSTFYVTLEPCAHQGKTPSCADLLIALGVKKVVIGARERNEIASGGILKLKNANIKIVLGVCKEQSEELLLPFLSWNKNRFIFFKLALRLDGSYDNGTITSESSRALVHSIRDRCDLLVIGGNTLRVDRPTLDARIINGKAPDILICTKKVVDKTIPLFNIKTRKVIVQDNLEIPKNYKNIMIEGGAHFLEHFKNHADLFLIFHNNKFHEESRSKIDGNLNLKLLHSFNLENDHVGWYKKI